MFSAFQTFESAILSIERLDLSNTIFGDSNMSSEQTPGMMTFAGCEFDNLF
jgi:hypothetical protein